MKGQGNIFGLKISGEVLSKLESRGFHATCLSTYDFTSLYTTFPHNLIKNIDLIISGSSKRSSKTMVHFILLLTIRKLF